MSDSKSGEKPKIDSFFMVYVDGRSMPTIKQEYEKAVTEAHRLAKKEKTKAYILQAVEVVEVEVQSIARKLA